MIKQKSGEEQTKELARKVSLWWWCVLVVCVIGGINTIFTTTARQSSQPVTAEQNVQQEGAYSQVRTLFSPEGNQAAAGNR